MKKTMLHSAIAAVIATFAVASSAAVITVDGTQKPITDTTIGGLVVQNGGSAVVDADGKDVSFNKEANFKTTKGETIYVGAHLIGQQDKIASLTINASMLNFGSLSANKSNDGLKEALQKPSLILRPESFYLLHRSNFCANDYSGYF